MYGICICTSPHVYPCACARTHRPEIMYLPQAFSTIFSETRSHWTWCSWSGRPANHPPLPHAEAVELCSNVTPFPCVIPTQVLLPGPPGLPRETRLNKHTVSPAGLAYLPAPRLDDESLSRILDWIYFSGLWLSNSFLFFLFTCCWMPTLLVSAGHLFG